MDCCDDCGSAQITSVFPDFGAFCADCCAARVFQPNGLPPPAAAPDPIDIVGPDGRTHRLHYRVTRWATGTGVELVESTGAYHFKTISTLGRHDQPIHAQVRHLREVAEASIGRLYLEAYEPDDRVLLAGDEVVGRLVWPAGVDLQDPRHSYDVVVDGRTMSWEEFGRTFEPFEGMTFRLVVEDGVDEVHR